ncbi:MAG: hypothetical protein RMJ67_04270 [Elusimicrobiota bacterium]|nr:hypothetical protein [Endomicrobiia bacterium]MDW8165708.1 hypothetical protein [Elusimicrobiota bacterium]
MKKIYVVGILSLMFKIGFCHHAMEYIEIESYQTAKKGEFIFHLHYDYFVDDQDDPTLDHWEFTYGVSYGILDRLMFDVHTHFAKFGAGHLVVDLNEPKYQNYSQLGPSPFIEAAAFVLQARVTEEKQLPIDIALAFKYEYPTQKSKELLDGKEVFEGSLILSKNFAQHSNICFNLNFGKDGEESIKTLALGVKTPLTFYPHGITFGVEFLVENYQDISNSWSILPAIYAPFLENIIFKTGIEFGKNLEKLRTNCTLMYRF